MILGSILITFAVTFVAGGALSYFFSATLYRPVERMVDALPLEKSCRDQSEFQMVASTVQELSKKAKTYENQLQFAERPARHQFGDTSIKRRNLFDARHCGGSGAMWLPNCM